MEQLVDSSLLKPMDGDSGEARFGMLQTIREFTLERLAASDEAAEPHRQHACYFLGMAETAVPLGAEEQSPNAT